MLNMKNTILSANVLHREKKLLIALVVMVAICCTILVGQVVAHVFGFTFECEVTRKKRNDLPRI